ncbi:MAG: DivIVA domain-containing protein [Proteobacteria bacterium]|nr:DivIVA domain-containing protein [Pseudomonadota bacterium]
MELSSRTIEERRFSSAMRGYDRTEVDSFLGEVARVMGGLEERLAIAERRAAQSETEIADLRTRVDKELQEATEARRRIINEAKREALAINAGVEQPGDASIVVDAAERAAAIVAEAETKAMLRLQEVDEIVDTARQEAERTVATAQEDAATTRAEASLVLSDARRRAKEVRAAAEAERSSVVGDISELKRIAEVARTGGSDLESLEIANIILTSGAEITIDLRDEVAAPARSSLD